MAQPTHWLQADKPSGRGRKEVTPCKMLSKRFTLQTTYITYSWLNILSKAISRKFDRSFFKLIGFWNNEMLLIIVNENLLYEPCYMSRVVRNFSTKSDTNQAVQPQKIDRGLKFRI